MFEFNQASIECTDELQEETGQRYGKDATDGVRVWRAYDLDYKEASPTRLLAQALIFSRWLGYHDADRGRSLHDEEIGAWRRIKKAYEDGKNAYSLSKSGAG